MNPHLLVMVKVAALALAAKEAPRTSSRRVIEEEEVAIDASCCLGCLGEGVSVHL